MKKNSKVVSCRLGKVGGEAVIEGVMMKAGDNCCTALCDKNGNIKVNERKFVSLKKKHKIFNIPILRGIVGFIESLVLSFAILNISAEVMGGEELQKEGRFERWLKKHLGVGLFDVIMVVAAILGVALALFLFLWLPTVIASLISRGFAGGGINLPAAAIAAIEGGLKILIFVSYILLVSLMPDIRRVFEYHGAEHKSIACFESGDELTPENAKKHTRFHPRCGTSFMFVMILLGVLLGFAIHLLFPDFDGVLYALTRILLLPLVVGVGYEYIIFAGKHSNFATRILSAPGLWMQRITTREPDEKQLEIAITALKYALPDEFPEFDREAFELVDAHGKTVRPAKSAEDASVKENEAENAEGAATAEQNADGAEEKPNDAQ